MGRLTANTLTAKIDRFSVPPNLGVTASANALRDLGLAAVDLRGVGAHLEKHLEERV